MQPANHLLPATGLLIPVGLLTLLAFRDAIGQLARPLPPEAAASVLSDPADRAPSGPVCIDGFSKNLCQGRLSNGVWTEVTCTKPDGTVCRTLIGEGATLAVSVRSNPDVCDPTAPAGRCDETPDLEGPLMAVLNFRLRRDAPCPVRGCWEGRFHWSHSALDVIIARGSTQGTLGVGSHRSALCINDDGTAEQCGPECENCYAAYFDATTGLWRIHVEGSLRGRVLAGPHRNCRICVTLQGEFEAPGGPDGPQPPASGTPGWRFCGTMDGVLECPCP
jgi:hypothetical protein